MLNMRPPPAREEKNWEKKEKRDKKGDKEGKGKEKTGVRF